MLALDYGFRIYNPAIGKFLSVDPLTQSYPWYTPYQFAGNKPIWAIDVDGLEEYIFQYREVDGYVTLIRKIRNVETKLYGGYGAAVLIKTDKRTGKPFSQEEKGMVQYQYFDVNNDPINEHRDYQGDFQEGAGEMMSLENNNWFTGSIYIGPNNPTYGEDEKPDYRREPQDLMDAAALRQDKDYGFVGVQGFVGAVLELKSVPADIALVQRANMVIQMVSEDKNDPYTGEPISALTLSRARNVRDGFSLLIRNKTSLVVPGSFLRPSFIHNIGDLLDGVKKIDDTKTSTLDELEN